MPKKTSEKEGVGLVWMDVGEVRFRKTGNEVPSNMEMEIKLVDVTALGKDRVNVLYRAYITYGKYGVINILGKGEFVVKDAKKFHKAWLDGKPSNEVANVVGLIYYALSPLLVNLPVSLGLPPAILPPVSQAKVKQK